MVADRTDSIVAQKARCRAHARDRGYPVVKVVHDIAVSGVGLDRPGLQDTFGFLGREGASDRHVLIIDDIGRLARTPATYREVCDTLAAAWVEVQCRAETMERAAGELGCDVARLQAFLA